MSSSVPLTPAARPTTMVASPSRGAVFLVPYTYLLRVRVRVRVRVRIRIRVRVSVKFRVRGTVRT